MSPLSRWKYLAVGGVAGLITFALTVEDIAGRGAFSARYTLAIVAPLGLLAVAARPRDDDASALPRFCIALTIIVNAAALYGNAQRYAVGERGSIFFLSDAKWSPPGGWWLTTLVALVGLGTLAIAGFLDPPGTPRSLESESIAARPTVSPVSDGSGANEGSRLPFEQQVSEGRYGQQGGTTPRHAAQDQGVSSLFDQDVNTTPRHATREPEPE